MIVSGGKIIEQCGYCGKYVTLNKWCGSLHICLSEEERALVDEQCQIAMNSQRLQLGSVGGNVSLRDLLKQVQGAGKPAQTNNLKH